jgi:hypothetical protein
MPGLLRGVARTAAIAGTATAVSNRVSRRQEGRWAQQDAQLSPPAPVAPAAAPAQTSAAPDDMDIKIQQLQQLSTLLEQGALSEAEFAAQKAKVLGS